MSSLTYLQVHLYFTIPITFILWLINRPWMNYLSWLKIGILLAMSIIYTTPWDNYLLWTNTWSYPESAVLGTIGLVPVEKYFFFIIETLMVSFWSTIVFRRSLPTVYFLDKSPIKTNIILLSSTLIIPVVIYFAPLTILPRTPSFYLSCILTWSLPVLGFLWSGTGNYIIKRITHVIFAAIVPSMYLCWVDLMALRAGTWKINEEATLGIEIVDKLPLEEVLFFFMVNFMVVFGLCALDKSFEVIDTFPRTGNTFVNLLKAFYTPEYKLEQQRIEDLHNILSVLKRASKSFWTASFIFPDGIRKDLSILYAFCRVTDDMVDSESQSKTQKRENLNIIRTFLGQLFPGKRLNGSWKYSRNTTEVLDNTSVDWKYFESVLNDEELSAFRAISTISHILPAEPFYELCRGYEWDIESKVLETEEELIEYSENVASSVAVLCTTIFCNRIGNLRDGLSKEKHEKMIKYARDMGTALQLTNIARDIITDSECLGRLYIPKSWLSKPNEELFAFRDIRKPNTIDNQELRNYALRMLELADKYKKEGSKGIPLLPRELRGQVLCLTEIYISIGNAIRGNPEYIRRTSLSLWEKVWIAVKCLYLPQL